MNAARRYSAVTFLTWLPTGLYVAPLVLLMLDRGLSVPTVALVGIAYSVTCAVLELPTGGLADAIGRRAVLLASCVASLAGLVMLGLATTVALFALSSFLRGVARALGSGPAEAWYVDTVHAQSGPDAPISAGLARGQVAGSAALAIGTLAGGLIPLGLQGVVAVPLAIPIFIAAATEAVRLVIIVVAMPEPNHQRQTIRMVLRSVPVNVVDGLRMAVRHSVLTRLMLITGAIGVALATIELLTPSWLATLTGTFEAAGVVYAIVAALGFAASAVGGSLSGGVERKVGSPARTGMVGLVVMAVSLVLLAGAALTDGALGLILAGVAYFAIFVGLGIVNPAANTVMHGQVESNRRATVLSVQSLALQAAGVLGVNLLARVPSTALAFGLVALLIGASVLLLRSIQTVPEPALNRA